MNRLSGIVIFSGFLLLAGCENSTNQSHSAANSNVMYEDGKLQLGDPVNATVRLMVADDDMWSTICQLPNVSSKDSNACALGTDEILAGYSLIEQAANLENTDAIKFLAYANDIELDASVERYRASKGFETTKADSLFPSASGPKRLGELWEVLASLGDIEAKAFMGYLYSAEPLSEAIDSGSWYVDRQNFRKAENYLREAAEAENIYAMNVLSDVVRQKNKTEAYEWSKRTALLGSAKGASAVAQAHWSGDGTIQNYVMAAAWGAIAESKGEKIVETSLKEFFQTQATVENMLIMSGSKQEGQRAFPRDFNRRVEELTEELFAKLPVGDVDGASLPSQLKAWKRKNEALGTSDE